MMIRQYNKLADSHNLLYCIWKETTLNGPSLVNGTSIATPVRATILSLGHLVDAKVLLDEEHLVMAKKILFELCFREPEP